MNTSLLHPNLCHQWWHGLDKTLLFLFLTLAGLGLLIVYAASQAVAVRVGLPANYFFVHQAVILPVGLAVMLGLSCLPLLLVRRLAVLGVLGCLVFLVLTLLMGDATKGARRWISVAGFSLQASEFIKPMLAVTCAWLLTEWHNTPACKGQWLAVGLYGISITLIILQPDLGMTMVVVSIAFVQLVLASTSLWWLFLGLPLLPVGLFVAYTFLPHVHSRVNRFLDPAAGDTYQIDQALKAMHHGGWFGVGPGNGVVKNNIPDAHADFVFSVLGEEFGIIACAAIVALFLVLFWRVLRHLLNTAQLFNLLAGAGLMTQLLVQAFVNMASSLHLIPTKGMTLPFISYGGSSLLAVCVNAGFLLAVTRRHDGRHSAMPLQAT